MVINTNENLTKETLTGNLDLTELKTPKNNNYNKFVAKIIEDLPNKYKQINIAKKIGITALSLSNVVCSRYSLGNGTFIRFIMFLIEDLNINKALLYDIIKETEAGNILSLGQLQEMSKMYLEQLKETSNTGLSYEEYVKLQSKTNV